MLKDLIPFLSKGKFVNVATCSQERMPNVAPKLIAKADRDVIYLVDYVIGKTYANLKENPRVSISFIDNKTLTGYQLNGCVAIIEEGEEFDKLAEEFHQIKTEFTVERILLDIRAGEKTHPREFSIPENFCILKMKIFEIVEISSSGDLKSKLSL